MGVRGPHAGQRLPHRTNGALHHVRLDGPATGGKGTGTVTVGKDKEEMDGVSNNGLQGGVNNKVEAEIGPKPPGSVVCAGTQRYNSVLALELCSAEIADEIMSGCGVSKCQGCFCG
jgi:hypothetical protein